MFNDYYPVKNINFKDNMTLLFIASNFLIEEVTNIF